MNIVILGVGVVGMSIVFVFVGCGYEIWLYECRLVELMMGVGVVLWLNVGFVFI